MCHSIVRRLHDDGLCHFVVSRVVKFSQFDRLMELFIEYNGNAELLYSMLIHNFHVGIDKHFPANQVLYLSWHTMVVLNAERSIYQQALADYFTVNAFDCTYLCQPCGVLEN